MYKPKLSVLFLILGLFLTTFSSAQDKGGYPIGAWYIYNGFFKVSPKVEFFFETQLRNNEVFDNPEAFFIRPYFTYNLFDELQVGISTEYHKHFVYAENFTNQSYEEEFRIDLQAIFSQNIDWEKVQHRYRYEFRNINSYGGNRMRYRLQITVPVNKRDCVKGTLFFNTNNEFFINNKPDLEFDQNRFYSAFGYHFTNSLNLQLGYLFVAKPDANLHRLQFFITQKLDFTKT